MEEVLTDEGLFPDDRKLRRDVTAPGDALNVSVMSLGGEELATVLVPGGSSVWELKGLIEMIFHQFARVPITSR